MHLTQPPPPLPADVLATPGGRALAAIALRCLAKDPDERWSSAAELKALFEALYRGESVEVASNATDQARRRRRGLMVGAGAALAAGVGGWLIFGRTFRASHRRPAGAVARPAAQAVTRQEDPGPMVVPLQPPRVVVTFESNPPGAETRLVDTGELLGLTPFHHSFTGDKRKALIVEMRAPGHKPARLTVSLATDRTVRARLRTETGPPAASPRPFAGRKRSGGQPDSAAAKDVTLNPFRR